MTLRETQSKFAHKLGLLLIYAYEQGYELTLGDAWRPDKRGHKRASNHYIRLAIDLNLFRNGKYLTSTKAYSVIGEFWESLGSCCAWGGRFNDGCHFSMEWKGRK